jgi:hypothetical protein
VVVLAVQVVVVQALGMEVQLQVLLIQAAEAVAAVAAALVNAMVQVVVLELLS